MKLSRTQTIDVLIQHHMVFQACKEMGHVVLTPGEVALETAIPAPLSIALQLEHGGGGGGRACLPL